jgi:hypothetical protein
MCFMNIYKPRTDTRARAPHTHKIASYVFPLFYFPLSWIWAAAEKMF